MVLGSLETSYQRLTAQLFCLFLSGPPSSLARDVSFLYSMATPASQPAGVRYGTYTPLLFALHVGVAHLSGVTRLAPLGQPIRLHAWEDGTTVNATFLVDHHNAGLA